MVSRHTLIHTLRLQTVLFQLLKDRFVHLAFFLWQSGNSWRLGSLSSAVTLPAVYPKAVSPLCGLRESTHHTLHRGDYFIPLFHSLVLTAPEGRDWLLLWGLLCCLVTQ